MSSRGLSRGRGQSGQRGRSRGRGRGNSTVGKHIPSPTTDTERMDLPGSVPGGLKSQVKTENQDIRVHPNGRITSDSQSLPLEVRPSSSNSSSTKEITTNHNPSKTRSQEDTSHDYCTAKKGIDLKPSTASTNNTSTNTTTTIVNDPKVMEKGATQPDFISSTQDFPDLTPAPINAHPPPRQHISTTTNDKLVIKGATPTQATPIRATPMQATPMQAFDSSSCLPKRPKSGTLGRPIRLRANHFEITQIPTCGSIYHYDVDIGPNKCSSQLCRQIIKQLEIENKHKLVGYKLAFDGSSNIYTSKPLPADYIVCNVSIALDNGDSRRVREYKVTIKYANTIPLDVLRDLTIRKSSELDKSQSALQALDVVLKSAPSMRFTTVGRSFFTQPDASRGGGTSIGQGREVWSGYYQSVRPAWKVMLNIDVSNTAFFKEQPVLNYLTDIIGSGDRGGRGGRGGGGGRDDYSRRDSSASSIPNFLEDHKRRAFAKEIKGLKVEVTHLSYPRRYKVKDVTRQGASNLMFDCEGKKCSVANYFKEKHKKELKYPHLPCLHMEGKNPSIFIPMEYCKVISQKSNKKLTGEQTKAMIRATSKPADIREREVLRKVNEAQFDKDEYLRDFGIKVCKDMTQVTGRVLDPPLMKYYEGSTVRPINGVWDGKQFCNGITIDNWGILTGRHFDEREFVSKLSVACRNAGMKLNPKPLKCCHLGERDSLERLIKNEFTGLHVQLIIVILSGRISYNEVKSVGDQFGITTQCIMYNNATTKGTPSTFANLCLKINSKLGGSNTVPQRHDILSWLTGKPFIVFGADVTHPSPGDKRSPSLAAVTASMDSSIMKYRAEVKVLKNRQEVLEIDQLARMVKNMLIKFYRQTKHKPHRIIFYRDGVSEGQFKQVIEKEVAAIQKACIDLEKDYKPGITFIVVQKRHHTRLFPVDDRDKHGKGNNVPPGTTVDTMITHPTEFDFYLCSHAGIQGTSKPAHYHVLWDDNDFSADSLQALSFQLCHSYVRCNRSVSYPAPTYYSHLAAFRARYKLQDWEEKRSGSSDTASSMSFSSDDLMKDIPSMQKAIEVNEILADTMYFV